jgi:hypothetical protein
MAVLDGKRNPDGILCTNLAQAAPYASTNSVDVGRAYTMLDVMVLATGGPATVLLQKRSSLVGGPTGPTRLPDTGAFVNVTDNNNPVAGIALTAGVGCTLRVAYPRGEYQLGVTVNAGGAAAITASYNLVGELR